MEAREALVSALQPFLRKRDLLIDAPMKRYTTLRLGGPASVLCEIDSVEQLARVLQTVSELHAPVFPLGNGSNLLVSDAGIDKLVVHIGDQFADVSAPVPLPDGRFAITAQAGATLQKLSNAAADAGLRGLEFAGGIPGTVGGGVCMNAGAYGGELRGVIDGVTAMTLRGETTRFDNEGMRFAYRDSVIQHYAEPLIVTSATVVLEPGDEETIRATMREFSARRREKQPLTVPCCGSTFKRPEGNFAGTLIEQCGLKGYRVGGCSVSTLHAGFLVNDEDGTAADYRRLIADVQRIVMEKTGVALTPEVRLEGW